LVALLLAGGGRRAEHGRRRRGRVGQELGAGARVGEQRLEQLAHDSERERALQLRTLRGGDPVAAGRGKFAKLREQPALADPGGTLDDERLGERGGVAAEQLGEDPELALALEQRQRGGG